MHSFRIATVNSWQLVLACGLLTSIPVSESWLVFDLGA